MCRTSSSLSCSLELRAPGHAARGNPSGGNFTGAIKLENKGKITCHIPPLFPRTFCPSVILREVYERRLRYSSRESARAGLSGQAVNSFEPLILQYTIYLSCTARPDFTHWLGMFTIYIYIYTYKRPYFTFLTWLSNHVLEQKAHRLCSRERYYMGIKWCREWGKIHRGTPGNNTWKVVSIPRNWKLRRLCQSEVLLRKTRWEMSRLYPHFAIKLASA